MKALRKWNSGRGRDLGSGAQLESQASGSADSHAGMQPGAPLRTAPHTPRPLSGRDESHMAQLAAMENYAGHGMFVDVPDAEARALEEAALRHAMEQSQQEAAARGEDTPTLHSRVQQHLLPSEPYTWEELPPMGYQHQQPARQSSVENESKPKRLNSLRKKLSFNSNSKTPQGAQPPSNPQWPQGNPQYGAQPNGYGPNSGAHMARGFQQGQGRFANGQPVVYRENPAEVSAAVAHSEAAARSQAEERDRRLREAQAAEDAFVKIAMQESVAQAQYEGILRDAKSLRRDLEHVLTKCLDHQADVMQQHCDLEQLMGELDHGFDHRSDAVIARQFAQSQSDVVQADTRVAAVHDCIQELVELERFITQTKPPTEEAVVLTEEIIRQLLARLSALGLGFGAPESKKDTSQATGILVSQFRHTMHLPGGGAEDEGAGTSGAGPSGSTAGPSTPPLVDVQRSASSSGSAHAADAARLAELMEPSRSASEAGSKRTAPEQGQQQQQEQEPAESLPAPLPATPVPSSHRSAASSASILDASVDELAAAVERMGPDRNQEQADGHSPAEGQTEQPPRAEISPIALPVRQQRSAAEVGPPREPPVEQESTSSSHREERFNLLPQGLSSNVMLTNEDMDAIFQCSDDEDGSGSYTGSVSSSVAAARSREQSKALLAKASSKLNSILRQTHESGPGTARRPGDQGIKRAPQVVHLYQELRKAHGDSLLCRDFTDANAAHTGSLSGFKPYRPVPPAEEQARVRTLMQDPEELQIILDDAEKYSQAIQKVAASIRAYRPRSMEDLSSFVSDCNGQLMAIRADEAAVLAQHPQWPKQRFDTMREAVGLFRELTFLGAKATKWMLQQGTCSEECQRIEGFFDTARVRIEKLSARLEAADRRFTAERLPWERAVFRNARSATLNLAIIYMSRTLFEVANLERSTVLQNEACLTNLAEAVRVAYKVHQFAGGFNGDALELFTKVKRLAQYYSRTLDPTWLKDNTRQGAAGTLQPWGLNA